MHKTFVLILLMFVAAFAPAREVPVDRNHVVAFKMPKLYRFRISRDRTDQHRPALNFFHFNKQGVKTISFKIFIHRDSSNRLQHDYQAIEYFKSGCRTRVRGSVENRVILHFYTDESSSTGKKVHYCSFTDRKIGPTTRLRPGQYRHVTIAFVKQGQWVFRAIAYSRKLNDRLYKRFLNTLASLNIRSR